MRSLSPGQQLGKGPHGMSRQGSAGRRARAAVVDPYRFEAGRVPARDVGLEVVADHQGRFAARPERSQRTGEGCGLGLADPDFALDAHRIEVAGEVVAFELRALETRAAVREQAEHVPAAAQLGERIERAREGRDLRLLLGRVGVRDFANEFALRRKPKPIEGLRDDDPARHEHVLAREAAALRLGPEGLTHGIDRCEQSLGHDREPARKALGDLGPEAFATYAVAHDGVVEVDQQNARQRAHERSPVSGCGRRDEDMLAAVNLDLRGRTAVITGASRGLGAGLATAFRARGLRLGLCARTAPVLADGPDVIGSRLDVRDAPAVADFAVAVEARFGAIDLWINNAGVLEPIEALRDIEPAAARTHLEVNVLGVLFGTQAFVRHLRRRGGEGVLVNLSSGAAQKAYAGWSLYCAAKAAVDRMTECVALEEAAHGLRAYAVAPGVIDTDMQALIRATPAERFPEAPRFIERKRENRFNTPGFVAERILALAFDPGARPAEVCVRLPDERPGER